jgi:phytoene desaturase
MSTQPPKRVIIVGAGPGGLAAAMLLAKAGLDVTLFERRSCVGGRTSGFGERGFRFDLGPTFFLFPEILRSLFGMCGYELDREVPMVKLDPHYRLVYGSGDELVVTPDTEAMQQRLAALSPEAARAFRHYLDTNRKKLHLFRSVIESDFSRRRDLLRVPLVRGLGLVRPWASLWRDLRRFFADPRIRLAFSFQAKYVGMSPFRCPSLFSILAFLELEYGVFHPVGGCGRMSEVMARIAGELGARIVLDEPVEQILIEGGRAVGVRTQEGERRADAVVVNADFARAMTRLVPEGARRRWTDARIARTDFSCSTFMMYLGLEGRYDHLTHHTICFARDYARNLEEIEKTHVLSQEPSFYVQSPAATDPGLAPEGMSTLYVLVPVTHQHANIDWDKERGPYRELVLRQLARIGCTDVESRIRYERIVTPADWDQEYEIHLGATFSLAHSLRQMLYWRPHNRVEDIGSLYLVGGGTHPGTGLPVIYEAARISSRLLLEDLGLDAGWLRAPEDRFDGHREPTGG